MYINVLGNQFYNCLLNKHLTIFCAESITAGLLASTIASVSGASAILKGSIVTYQGQIKTKLLLVDEDVIRKYTAESAETTRAMVEGLLNLSTGADILVAVTGVASKPVTKDYVVDKPVGQIYVAIAFKGTIYEFNHQLGDGERNIIREKAVAYIFERILELIDAN